jgi:hypothetical protein
MSITSILWEEISNSFIKIKEAHNNQAKRAIKSQIPKQQSVREEIVHNLVKYFNRFVNTANTYWTRLTPEHKEWVNKHFNKLRDRTILAFTNLGIKYVVPNSSIVPIDINILQTDSDSESDTPTNTKMPLTTSEFFNLADKLVSKSFNGDVSGLISFIDAITLLKANCEGQEENAVNFVKTRLTGKARLAVTDDIRNLDEIIQILKQKCSGEKSHTIEAKLLTLKQNGKDAVSFTNQINELAASLQSAYLSEGVRADTAETFAKNRAIRTMASNARSERTKLIMEAGNFENLHDAVTKFITVDSDSNSSNVLFTNSRKNYNNSYNNNRQNFSNRRGNSNQGNNYNRRPNNGNWRNQQNFNVGHDQNNARSSYTHNNTRSYGNRNNARNFQNSNVRSFNSENREGPLPNSREGEM